MIPDRVKVDPMKELLQKFHGSKYITTIDLSSAFLQVKLHISSRKWTSFCLATKYTSIKSCRMALKIAYKLLSELWIWY